VLGAAARQWSIVAPMAATESGSTPRRRDTAVID